MSRVHSKTPAQEPLCGNKGDVHWLSSLNLLVTCPDCLALLKKDGRPMSVVHYASQTRPYDYVCGAAKKILDDYPTTIESLVTCPECLALLNAPGGPPGTVAELLPGIEEIAGRAEIAGNEVYQPSYLHPLESFSSDGEIVSQTPDGAKLAALRKRITDRADELDGYDEDSFYSAGAVADDLRRLLED